MLLFLFNIGLEYMGSWFKDLSSSRFSSCVKCFSALQAVWGEALIKSSTKEPLFLAGTVPLLRFWLRFLKAVLNLDEEPTRSHMWGSDPLRDLTCL